MRHAAPRRRAGKRRGAASAGRAAQDTPQATETAPQETRAAAPAPGKWEQLPYVLTLLGTAVALGTIMLGTHHLKSGTLVLAGVLLAAAVARLVLPDRLVGMLSSRRRLVDVAIFAALGLGLLVTGLGVAAPG